MKGMIFDIEHGSFVDGPGIRTTVFFKGCNLKCAWCHNPESQIIKRQMMFYRDKCIGCGKCKELCPHNLNKCELCGKCELYCTQNARKIVGKEYTSAEIIEEIIKDKSFYDNSNGGVTFSGGECMLQIDFLCELLKICKERGIHTAVDTAGNVPFSSFERILPYTDLFLYDVKSMDSGIHRKYTGAGNELILSNLEKLLQKDKRIWVRVPVIPSVNDSADNILKLKQFLAQNGNAEKIELLPYHRMGENKHDALNISKQVFDVPKPEHIESLKRLICE